MANASDKVLPPGKAAHAAVEARKKLLLLAGDGIGGEIMPEVRHVIDWFVKHRALPVDIDEEAFGISAWKRHGELMPATTWQKIADSDAIMFGAIGSPEYDDIPAHARQQDQLLRIRRELDLYINLRPIKARAALADVCCLRPEVADGTDFVIVRELSGGIYFGKPRGIERLADGSRRGTNTMTYTTGEIERVARAAFGLARSRRGALCSVDKSNVLECSQLWRETVQALGAREFPDVALSHMYVDNCAMQIVRAPTQFDVILTENLFGDILSDCAAGVGGSLGMLPSVSMTGEADPQRRAFYEPCHGSAPDIAGRQLANPLAAILSFSLCLQHTLQRPEDAALLENAVDRVLEDGARTKDICRPGMAHISTREMGERVRDALDNAASSR